MTVVRNTLINMWGRVGTTIVSLALTALLVRKLGQTQFGLLMLARSIAGNTTILESLFGMGITRHVALYEAKHDEENCQKVINTGMAVSIIQAALVVLALTAMALLFFDSLFARIPASFREEGKVLFYIFLFSFGLQAAYLTLMRVLEGFQRYRELRLIDISYNLILLATLFVYLTSAANPNLTVLAGVYVVMEGVRWALAYIFLVRSGVSIRLHPSSWDKPTFMTLFKFGNPLLLAKVSTMATYRIHALLIGVFLTLETVAQYQVAYQAQLLAVGVLGLLTSALLPSITEKSVKDAKQLSALFLRGSRYMICCTSIIAILVFFLHDFLLQLWVGPDFGLAGRLMVLFMLQCVLASHQGLAGLVLVALNRHQRLGQLQFAASALNLVFVLGAIPRLGASALIWGLIGESCLLAPTYLALSLRALKIPFLSFLKDCLIPSWIFLVLSFAAGWLLRLVLSINAVPVVLSQWLQVILLPAALSVFVWFTIFEFQDRKNVLKALRLAPSA